MHRWGYAPRVEVLSQQLIGGPASVDDVLAALRASDLFRLEEGHVALAASEALLERSRTRSSRNQVLNGGARSLARGFAQELARICPFVECVALSGSVASGGYVDGDDVDFDLFVEDGTKYTVYLIANLIGLRYSLRYRKRQADPDHRVLFLPKIICINVVWQHQETNPFRRQDAGLAFELLRCEPLLGARRFADVLSDNSWIDEFLPQARTRRWAPDLFPESGRTARLLSRVYAHPWARRLLERLSRAASYAMYRAVQQVRRPDARARERMEFLRRMKYPYEVFQD